VRRDRDNLVPAFIEAEREVGCAKKLLRLNRLVLEGPEEERFVREGELPEELRPDDNLVVLLLPRIITLLLNVLRNALPRTHTYTHTYTHTHTHTLLIRTKL